MCRSATEKKRNGMTTIKDHFIVRFTKNALETERRHEQISAKINGLSNRQGNWGYHTRHTNFKHSTTELCTAASSYAELTRSMTTINLRLKCGS